MNATANLTHILPRRGIPYKGGLHLATKLPRLSTRWEIPRVSKSRWGFLSACSKSNSKASINLTAIFMNLSPEPSAEFRAINTNRRLSWKAPIKQISIPNDTGPFTEFDGTQSVVLLDCENLSLSARDRNLRLSYEALAGRFAASMGDYSVHAFFSQNPNDSNRVPFFSSLGWIPHPQNIEVVRTFEGIRVRANSDNAILFCAGVIASRFAFRNLIIGSGDGDLATDLSRFVAEFKIPRRIFTLSVPGSTSARLSPRENPLIAANFEIGLDCLSKIRHPKSFVPKILQ